MNQPKIVVIFGKPGAGKTTVAEAALTLANTATNTNSTVDCTTSTQDYNSEINDEGNGVPRTPTDTTLINTKKDMYVNLDLDVCIPQWMKDNFSKGIYPTLEQRIQFATSACDYVDSKIIQYQASLQSNSYGRLHIIIGFSFVNVDLRDIFRDRFPSAIWILLQVNDNVAKTRIMQREGHFYKCHPNSDTSTTTEEKDKSLALGKEEQNQSDSCTNNPEDKNSKMDSSHDSNNSDWIFSPVTFDHIILDGEQPVSVNAGVVVQTLLQQ